MRAPGESDSVGAAAVSQTAQAQASGATAFPITWLYATNNPVETATLAIEQGLSYGMRGRYLAGDYEGTGALPDDAWMLAFFAAVEARGWETIVYFRRDQACDTHGRGIWLADWNGSADLASVATPGWPIVAHQYASPDDGTGRVADVDLSVFAADLF